ncbi:MAG: cytochrome c3 family protein [Candidatus Thiodiazotropha sp.]
MLFVHSRTSLDIRYNFIAAMCVLFAYTLPAVAAIQGSMHDLSGSGITVEICNICHTPHAGNGSTTTPLWNHTISTVVYTLYNSPTMDVAVEQPGPGSMSRLCLSCHDGTVAIDSFGGDTGTPGNVLTGLASKGTDLSDDHPVGVQWVHQTLGGGSSSLCMNCHDIHNIIEPPGKELKFFAGRVECPSCHDVHNSQVMDVKLLRKPLAGSALCFHCHPK